MGSENREREVHCADCKVLMRLRGKTRLKYECPKCKASLIAGANGKPQGVPGNKETREWRRRAHMVFEKMWKSEGVSRSSAQRWLAKKLKIPPTRCHFGYMNIPMLKRVVAYSGAVCDGELAGPTALDTDPETSEYRRMANDAVRLLRRAGAHPTALRYWIAHHTGGDPQCDVGGFTSQECKRIIERCERVFCGGAKAPRGVKLDRKLKMVAIPKLRSM